MKLIKYIVIAILLIPIYGCDLTEEAAAVNANFKEETIWAFIYINIPEEGNKIDSYYYYARISKSLYQSISSNKIKKGFILLQNVKYWGDDDIIYDYRNNENTGDIIFRIENISRVTPIKGEPKTGMGQEQFEDQKKVKESKKQLDKEIETIEPDVVKAAVK